MVMDRFKNKIAVVTGCSSGIGRAISAELLTHGITVVGLDKDENKLQEFNNELKISNHAGTFYPMKCDVSQEIEVQSTFAQILSDIGAVHILVNNAGVLRLSFLTDVSGEIISDIFDTNVKGVLLCSKEAMNCMMVHSIKGHIININSIAGRFFPIGLSSNRIYQSSKHALAVLSEGLKREMSYKQTGIKVTNISPGWVRTQMTDQILKSINRNRNDVSEKSSLEPKDIADACILVLDTPPKVLISELTVMPIHQSV